MLDRSLQELSFSRPRSYKLENALDLVECTTSMRKEERRVEIKGPDKWLLLLADHRQINLPLRRSVSRPWNRISEYVMLRTTAVG